MDTSVRWVRGNADGVAGTLTDYDDIGKDRAIYKAMIAQHCDLDPLAEFGQGGERGRSGSSAPPTSQGPL